MTRSYRTPDDKRTILVPAEVRLAVFRLCKTKAPNDERIGRTAMAKKLGIARCTMDEILEQGGVVKVETLEKVKAKLIELEAEEAKKAS